MKDLILKTILIILLLVSAVSFSFYGTDSYHKFRYNLLIQLFELEDFLIYQDNKNDIEVKPKKPITMPTSALEILSHPKLLETDKTSQTYLRSKARLTDILHYYAMRTDIENHTIYMGPISFEMLEIFLIETDNLADLGNKEIIIDLHSPGGGVFAMDLILTQIQRLKEKGIKIITRVRDNKICMSACVPIFLSGDERLIQEDAVFMVHPTKFSGRTSRFFFNHPVYKTYKEMGFEGSYEYFENIRKVCPLDTKFVKAIFHNKTELYFDANWLKKKGECGSFYTKIIDEDIKEYHPISAGYKQLNKGIR